MSELIAALGQALPAGAILAEPADKAPYEQDWRQLHNHPSVCVVLPPARSPTS